MPTHSQNATHGSKKIPKFMVHVPKLALMVIVLPKRSVPGKVLLLVVTEDATVNSLWVKRHFRLTLGDRHKACHRHSSEESVTSELSLPRRFI